MKSSWYTEPCLAPDSESRRQAEKHQNTLTKPPKSLGELENIALDFAAWQGNHIPSCEGILVRIFAGDHGICKHSVSAFPQSVTAQMLSNFLSGGAAISVLAKRLDADFGAVNLGTCEPLPDMDGLVNAQLMEGTNDFSQTNAMSDDTMMACMNLGAQQINQAVEAKQQLSLFIGGDMGIGNTSSASTIYSLALGSPARDTVGPGTGLDSQAVQQKISIVDQAIRLHQEAAKGPLEILARVGGLEIAALCGAYIRSAQQQIPILVDGFITTAAALLAAKLNPSVREWMMFAHVSAEPAHALALEHLNASPLLNLGMRLGEGSGAAIACPLIMEALALHREMATFESAGVSQS